MELLIDRRDGEILPDGFEKLLETLIINGLSQLASLGFEISISFVDRAEIQQLNHAYRGIDCETDVLSFPFFDDPVIERLVEFEQNGRPVALGEIVVCASVAKAQADEYGHSFLRELSFLAIHGLLHLLGYDHENPEQERLMTDIQERILTESGILR